jgi:hypothetical protein
MARSNPRPFGCKVKRYHCTMTDKFYNPRKILYIIFFIAIDGDRPIPSFELEYAVPEDKVSSYNRTDFINFIRDYATPQEIFEDDTKSAREEILNFYLSNFTKKSYWL